MSQRGPVAAVARRLPPAGLSALLLLLPWAAPALSAPSITVSAVAAAASLPLDGEGSASTHIVKVGDLAMATDGAAGFTVSITSTSLTKGDQRTPIAFQVALVDDDVVPAAAAFTVASGDILVHTTAAAGAVNKDLYIKYLPATRQDPGSFSATVHVTIADN
jgi:hypothetical protein